MKEKTSPLASTCLLWGWLAGSNLTVVQMSVMLGCMALIHGGEGWGGGGVGGVGGDLNRSQKSRGSEQHTRADFSSDQTVPCEIQNLTCHTLH